MFITSLVEKDQGDHDQSFDKYKENVQKINVGPLWTKRVRSVAIAAFKCWNNIHPNGRDILLAEPKPVAQLAITRRQQKLNHNELNICPVGLTNVGLPGTVLETFAYSAAIICNDKSFGVTEKMSTCLDEFKNKLFAADLCCFEWCKDHICNSLL